MLGSGLYELALITRAAFATGFLTSLLALSALAASPPDLTVRKTNLDLGDVYAGAGAHADGHIYYAGGFISGKVSGVVKEIDLLNKTLTTVTSLPTPRSGLGLAEQIANGVNHLYAVGGVDGKGHPLNTVEVYNFTTDMESGDTNADRARVSSRCGWNRWECLRDWWDRW